MSGEFFLIVAVVLVLGSVWIWINVLLFGKRAANSKDKSNSSSTAEPAASSTHASSQRLELDSAEAKGKAGVFSGADRGAPVSESAGGEARGETRQTAPKTDGAFGNQHVSSSDDKGLSVVVSDTPVRSGKPRLFDRPAYPFRINETIPAFDDEVWRACFYRLTEDEEVLGWVAFAGEIVGASDRDYDNAFVDVLRSYQHTVEKLRKEVGLTHVSETSIVAEEGKIWFFAVVDDTWIALFADHDADIHEIANRLIGPVRVQLAHQAE